MSKKRRIGALAIASITILGPLVGCGQSSGGSAGDGTGTVKMVLWPGPEGDAMKEVVEKYNDGQGEEDGINVELVLLSRSDTLTKEATEMAAKSSSFDAYFTNSYTIDQHAPYLEPLDLDTDSFFPQAVEGMSVDDQLLGVPLDLSMHALFYRKDLIDPLLEDPAARDKFGDISDSVLGQRLEPKEPEEWDWDDFLAAAAYFSQTHNPDSPTEYGTQMPAKNTPFNVMYWDNVLWSLGGNWMEEGSEPALDSDAATRAMEIYQTAFDEGLVPADSSQAEFPELQASMQAGTVAFLHQWVAGYASLTDPQQSPQIASKVGVAPPPGDKAHVHFLGVGINKYSKNKAATEKWFEYLASDQAQRDYAAAGGVPSVPSVLKDASDDNPILGEISDWVEQYGYVEPRLEGTTQYQLFVALGDALSAAWAGEESAESSLAEAQSALEDYAG